MTNLTFRLTKSTTAVLGLLLALSSTTTQADPMNVTATVLEVCELGTITDTAFGDLTPGSLVDKSGTGTIEWRCSDGTTADITINQGLNGDRTMDGPGVDTIAYELYKEVAHTNVWGDTAALDLGVTGAGMTSFTTETVYGEVLHADYVDALEGAYSDTVTVLITIN